MKKVAVINTVRVYSTGKIAVGLNDYLNKNGFNSVLCYGYGEKIEDYNYYRINSSISHYLHALRARVFGDEGSGSVLATKTLIEFLRKRKTEVVYLVSLHGYYINRKMLFDYLANDKIKVVYVMIDENAFVAKCGYFNDCNRYTTECSNCPQKKEYPASWFFDKSKEMFNLKKQAYSKMDITFVGPRYTVETAKKSSLLKTAKLFELDEAINMSLYYPRNASNLRKKLGIGFGKKIIVCVAPFSYERKGCKYFLELANIMREYREYIFVHVGFDVDNVKCPNNYIPIGFVDNQDELAEYYSLGDVFVFPSLLDTMPNACLEAMACGTPIIGFNISGMPYIAKKGIGRFVEPRNVEALMESVVSSPRKNEEIIKKCREYALSRYDNRRYFEKLTQLIIDK